MSYTTKNLVPEHQSDLARSGLSNEAIERCQFQSIHDPEKARQVLGWKSTNLIVAMLPAMQIPYFDSHGKVIPGYARLRPLHPRKDAKGKPIKYESPKGLSNHAYFPPGIEDSLADPLRTIFITEGEKKAAKAVQEGFPCIGLTGVYGWQAKREKDSEEKPIGPRLLIPDLEGIAWQGRTVYIVFDSDAATNKNVKAAERHLQTTLQTNGAIVHVVRLPASQDGSKQGLDDYLVASGGDALRERLSESARQPNSNKEKNDKKPSAADILVQVGRQGVEVFHDAQREAYVTIKNWTYRVRSRDYKMYLIQQYRSAMGGKVPNNEAIASAINSIEAEAILEGQKAVVHVRVAEHEGSIYIDLADESGTVIAISAQGWQTITDSPVWFVRPSSLLAIPTPERGGNIDQLRGFLNCPDDDAFALVKGWIAAAFLAHGPYFVLVLTGEQGSAKSTTARILKSLIDPCQAMIRSFPTKVDDLVISAKHCRLLAYDNISTLSQSMSDSLCRLATGGGLAKRQLYTDEDEIIIDVQRPLILNGIEDCVVRPDLAERSIKLVHPAIPGSKRRTEMELNAEFKAVEGKLFGAILDRLCNGLKHLSDVNRISLPRMADAAAFAIACEIGAGEELRFLQALSMGHQDSETVAVQDSIVAQTVIAIMTDSDVRENTPSELYREANRHVPDPTPKDWPKSIQGFTGKLRRITPALRRVAKLDINADIRSNDAKRTRMIHIVRIKDVDAHTQDAGRDTDDTNMASNGFSSVSNDEIVQATDGLDDQDDVSGQRSRGRQLTFDNNGSDLSALFQ